MVRMYPIPSSMRENLEKVFEYVADKLKGLSKITYLIISACIGNFAAESVSFGKVNTGRSRHPSGTLTHKQEAHLPIDWMTLQRLQ